MSDPTDIGKTADATKEVAKAASKAIDAGSKAGEFFSKVMGDLITDGIGLVGDKIRFYRIEKAVSLAEKADKLLQGRNVQSIRVVAPNIALPIIEAAAIESDDELHSKWTELLAQAMDAEAAVVDRRLVDLLASLSPTDIKVFDAVIQCTSDDALAPQVPLQNFRDDGTGSRRLAMRREEVEFSFSAVLFQFVKKFAPERIKISEDGGKSINGKDTEDFEISLDNLASHGLLMTRGIEWNREEGGVFLEDRASRTGIFYLTDFARRFARSIGYQVPQPQITHFT